MKRRPLTPEILYPQKKRRQKLQEYLVRKLKFYYILLQEFKLPNICMILTIFVGGYILYSNCEDLPFTDAMFAAFAAAFFEFILPPPYPWPVQVFLYLAPLVGVFVVACGISIFVAMLFGEKQNLQDWWVMTALTYDNHIVVCGVGKVGYRIINELRKMDVMVIGIEKNYNKQFVEELLLQKIPIILGNVRNKSILEKANVAKARTVICATDDDLTNIDCAFTARNLNPDVKLVLRIFDDNLAEKISEQFDFPTVSTASSYAPIFAAKAVGMDISLSSFTIYNQLARLISLEVCEEMDGKTVAEVEENLKIKILGYESSHKQTVLPCPKNILRAGEKIIIVSIQ